MSEPRTPELQLDAPREQVLEQATRLIAAAWDSFDQARSGQPIVDESVRRMLREPLPGAGEAVRTALAEAAQILDESIAQPRPRYFAFVGSSGLPIGVVADALASCFDINLAVYAGAASEIEEQAVRWVGELIGFPVGAGAFTSGGTISNLTALAAARERALPGAREHGMSGHRSAVYCSQEAHYSVMRAVELLGIGARSVRALPIDERRRLRADAVAEAVDRDLADGITPVAVVATAGSTLTGAIDPIGPLADVCGPRGVWLHVDGAYGVAAACVPDMSASFAGLERADSVSLDAHKWLYLPKACGVIVVRRREDLHHSFAHDEGYMPHERDEQHAVDVTLEYSRPFRALKLWLAFRVHGADAFRRAIERNLLQARQLHAELGRHSDLEALAAPQLSIVPFRHVPAGVDDLDAHNARLGRELQRDARVYVAPAVIDGHVYLRPCIVNFRTSDEDVQALVEIAREVGQRLAREAG
ncbi:MAG: aromatic-L-amino-acid/L-tryptophan decarboxylase [Gaiellales bacterium]|nr:aromatic-L-amino-acid/L-tryptophan decarboxylase [Gaiellales bacterium]